MGSLTDKITSYPHWKGISFDHSNFTSTPTRTGSKSPYTSMLDNLFVQDGTNAPTIIQGPISTQNAYLFTLDSTTTPLTTSRLYYGSPTSGQTGNSDDIRRAYWDGGNFDRVYGIWVKTPDGGGLNGAINIHRILGGSNGSTVVTGVATGETSNGVPIISLSATDLGSASQGVQNFTQYGNATDGYYQIEFNKWYFVAWRKRLTITTQNPTINTTVSGTLTYDLYINGLLTGTGTITSFPWFNVNMIEFGRTSAAFGRNQFGLANWFAAEWSDIGTAGLAQIYSAGVEIPKIVSAEPMTSTALQEHPSNVTAIYRPETPNGFLADTIVGYSPEHYYKFNENLVTAGGVTKPPIVNYGTVPVANGTVGSYFNTFPTLNATGGLKGKGTWVFNYSSGTACPRISLNTQSTQLADRNWSAGLFFKTNFTTPAITHDTAGYQLWFVGSTNRAVTVTFVGGTSSDTNKGKLRFAVAGGSTFTTTARYDDQSWHYVAIRAVLTGSTITYEFYLDGSLFVTTTVSDSSTTSGAYQLGDSTVSTSINSTGNNTFELSDTYLSPYTTIAAPQIAQIWYAANNPPTPTPVNRTHQAEPLVAGPSELLHPVITVVQGDSVQSTTSFAINATFPSPNFSTGENVTINVDIFENVDVVFGDNIFIETGADAVIPSTEVTASAILVEPIVSRPAMTATATLPMPVIYVAPNYFSLVRNLNPVFYIQDGQSAPVNYGSWPVNSWNVEYIDDNVTSGEEMSSVGNGKSWRVNTGGQGSLTVPRLSANITNGQTLINNLYATRAVSLEVWYYSVGRPRLPGLNYIESGPLFGDGVATIGEVYDWWGCTGDEPLYRQVLIGNLIAATFGLENDPVSVTYRTYENGEPEFEDWNHVVITYEPVPSPTQVRQKVYLNGSIISNLLLNISSSLGPDNIDLVNRSANPNVGPSLCGAFGITGGQAVKTADNVKLDEFAIYPLTLNSTQVSEHYSFLKSLSPNENVFVPVIEPSALMGNHLVIAQDNFIYEAQPMTASGIVVQPGVIAGRSIDHIAQTMDSTAELVQPALSIGVNLSANIDVVYAEMNLAFALSSIYYDYVQANIAPYRYVTFDGANPYLDYGSDNDYAVAPVVVGGTIVNPDLGINGKSAKTAGINYITDGVILKESEHDDEWGSDGNHYSSSFWMQRAADDTSTGLRIIANAHGYGTGEYFLLYHYQNKLHFEFRNYDTLIKQTSANNVNLFDFGTHFIAFDLDHSGQTDTAKIYVDAVLVMTINLGTARLSLRNGAPIGFPNSETQNFPRYSVGCLITPFATTALPVVPTNTKLIIDEIFWDKNSISLAQVAALYNMMPGKTNSVQTPLAFEASALFVMPTISTDINISSDAQLASAELLDPTLYVVKNNIFAADFMVADATMPGALRRDDVNINAEFMLASSSIGGAGTPRLVDAAPCTANIELINRRVLTDGGGIRVNSARLFEPASVWVTYVRLQNETNIIPTGNVR